MKRTVAPLALLLFSIVSCSHGSRKPQTDDSATVEVFEVVDEAARAEAALACRYAPVVVNELLPYGYAKPGARWITPQTDRGDAYDWITNVTYDLSETASHVFIQYTIFKPWSEFAAGKVVNYHFLDTEDVFLVLEKRPDVGPKPVYYSTNAHGSRIEYFHADARADAAELRASIERTRRLEGRYSKSPKSIFEGFRNRSRVADRISGSQYPASRPYFHDNPFVISKARDHALSGLNPANVVKHAALFKSGELNLFVPSCFDRARLSELGLGSSGALPYRLERVKDFVAGMTYSPEAIRASPDAVKACSDRTVRVRGEDRVLTGIPRFVDNSFYLRERQNFADRVRREWGADVYAAKLGEIKGSLTHTKEYTSKDVFECPRLDPAEYLEKRMPATFKMHGGAREYLRHHFAE